jgi:hypothetical protein
MLAEAEPELSAAVANTVPLTMNSTVPVGLLPETVAVAVNEVPKETVDGTPESVVLVVPRLPVLTVMT